MEKTRKKTDELEQENKTYTCFSCGLFHEKVEAQGIWYCPNALCMGCGGGWFRQTLKSYKELDDASRDHTVDHDEWLKKGIIHNREHKIDRDNFQRNGSFHE